MRSHPDADITASNGSTWLSFRAATVSIRATVVWHSAQEGLPLTRREQDIIDPRAFAVGTIGGAYVKYSHIGEVPALGYSDAQRSELEETLVAAERIGLWTEGPRASTT